MGQWDEATVKYPIVVGHWRFAHIILYYYCKLYSMIFIHLLVFLWVDVFYRIFSNPKFSHESGSL